MGLDAQSQEAASFAWPTGLSLSKDSLFVADRNSHRVRKLSLEAKSCSSIIGAGSDPYTLCPQGVLEYPCDVEWIPDLEILAVAELCHPQVLLWDPKDQSTRNLAIESGAIPSGLSYSPEHQSLVISSTNKSTLTIIHLGTGEEKELDPS